MTDAAQIRDRFRSVFGGAALICRAPGRINLIGEHTDYNDGFVMPAAIDASCWVAAARRNEHRLVVASENLREQCEFDLSAASLRPAGKWSDYVAGVAVVLASEGVRVPGASLLVSSDVPMGAGLSSSAALEVAAGLALTGLARERIPPGRLARICQRAENEFVGTRCGIMDQFASLHGREGHALLLDCRSFEYETIRLPQGASIVVCDTRVKHAHAAGEYNRRRTECEEAVETLSAALPGIRALRDVTLAQLRQHQQMLREVVFRRARHVVSENDRAIAATRALREGDLRTFGALMQQSHASLRDDYEVSSPELDAMTSIALEQPGVYGARMTGGGFGGCVVALVDEGRAHEFSTRLAAAYESAVHLRPAIRVCSAGGGAEQIAGEAWQA